jgi:flagellar biosynthesis/type III secretory pathway protein FliH
MPDVARLKINGRLMGVRVVSLPPAGAPAADQAASPGAAAPSGGQGQSAPAPSIDIEALLAPERKKLASASAALQSAAGAVAALRARTLKDAETEMVELAICIARKVLMQEIAAGRYEIEPIVRQAVASACGDSRQEVVVRLSPQDFENFPVAGEAIKAQDSGVRYVADPSVSPAECIVEMADGVIGSSIEQHLDGVSEALKSIADE